MTAVSTMLACCARAVLITVAIGIALSTPAMADDHPEAEGAVELSASSVVAESHAGELERRDHATHRLAGVVLSGSAAPTQLPSTWDLPGLEVSVDAVVVVTVAFIFWFRRRGRRSHDSRDIGFGRETARMSKLPVTPVRAFSSGRSFSWAHIPSPIQGTSSMTNTINKKEKS